MTYKKKVSVFRQLAIVAALVMPMVAANSASADLLTNGSFESVLEYGDPGLPNWFAFFGAGSTGTFSTVDGAYTGTVDPTDGAHHLSISNDGTADGFSGVFQTVAGSGGLEYTFSFDARSNSGASFPMGAEYRMEYFDAGLAQIGVSANIGFGGSLTDSYQNFTITDTAVAGTEFVRAVVVVETFSASGTPGNLFVDNAVLTAVPEPGSAVVLLLTGLGFAASRRRR